MTNSIDEKIKKKLDKQKQAQERARNRAIAKMNDPKEKEKRLAKSIASQERSRKKQMEKLNDPEHQKKLQKKRIESQKKRYEKSKLAPKPQKKPKSKGLKGRTPTAHEQKIMNMIGTLGCICCHNKGRHNPVISLHHIDGRTKENAHALVLPLCAFHHDTALDKENLVKYPDMIPIHAKGKLGGKAQWRVLHGHEMDLLEQCYSMLGLSFDLELAS